MTEAELYQELNEEGRMSLFASRGQICCCCGAPRHPTQAPVHSFGNSYDRSISVKDHREIDATHIEQSPSLIASVSIWRNGGGLSGEHICDECIVIGLRQAKHFVDTSLAALDPTFSVLSQSKTIGDK